MSCEFASFTAVCGCLGQIPKTLTNLSHIIVFIYMRGLDKVIGHVELCIAMQLDTMCFEFLHDPAQELDVRKFRWKS